MTTVAAPWLPRPSVAGPGSATDGGFAESAALPARVPRARGVRAITLVHVVVALAAFSNLGRLPALWLLGHELPVLPQEVVLVAALAFAALACVRARQLRVDAVAGAATLFALVGAGATFATASRLRLDAADTAYALAYLLRWVTYMGLYVAVINVGRADDAEPLWTTFERTLLAFAIFGVVQAIAIPEFAQRVYPVVDDNLAWDVQGHRLVSSVLDPNYAGAMIVLALLVQLGRLAFGVRIPLWKPLLLAAAVVATASRSSLLALAIGGLVILSARGLRRGIVRFGAVAVALTLPFVPVLLDFGRTYQKFGVADESAMARLVSYMRALTVFTEHPVFGIGFNTWGFVQASYGWNAAGRDSFTLDGGLIFIAVLTGVVGLAVYVGMLAAVVRRCRRLWRDERADARARGTALGAAAAVPALCAHSLFVNSLLLPWIVELTAVLWGVVFLMTRTSPVPDAEAP